MHRRKKSILDLIAETIFLILKGLWYMLKISVPIILMLLTSIFYAFVELVHFIWNIWGYNQSEYRNITNNSWWNTFADKGRRGEYLIYRHLREKNANTKWLFNVYIPRGDGRTTEIDVLMIHQSGVYVFESKNYTGWIYGSSKRENWTQCIKPSEEAKTIKYKFFNPIMQNNLHVKHLEHFIDSKIHKHIYPVVVFGDKCVLKNIELDDYSQVVVKRQDIKRFFKSQFKNQVIDSQMINEIYDSLYQYTQISEQMKKKHIEDIHNAKADKTSNINKDHI